MFENTAGAPEKNQSGVLDLLKKYQAAKTKAADTPTVSELLDKYAETQDKLYQSFIIKSEMSGESSSSKPGEVGLVRHIASTDEIRFDDKNGRFSDRTFIWGNVGSAFENIPKDNPAYQSYMWDGKDFFQYARSPFNPVSKLGKVHLTRNRARDTSNKPHHQGGLSGLRGAIFGSNERIESELRRAQTISVQDRTEKIGDSECYVVDAITKLGKITVWIDPKHGYNIAKFNLEISGKRGDIVYGRPLEEDDIIHLSQRVTRFEKINGFWIPIEGDSSYHRDMGKDYSESRTHEKITEIKLNVDHDALGSFVPDDIMNGARVFLIGVEGIIYTWQDGCVVDEKGQVIMDCRPDELNRPAEPKPKSSSSNSVSPLDLLRKYQTAQTKVEKPPSKERVVHFPKDCSIGRVYLVKRQPAKERLWHNVFGWVERDLGEARGDVKVPANGMLRLDIRGDEWRKTKPFAAIGPNDIQILNLYNCYDVDDFFMLQIGNLTGLEALFVSQSTLTPRGINYIRNFKQLRALVIPDYIQSKELEQLGELTLLEYLNFGGPMVNDEKLAVIGKLTWLTQLSIGGSEVSAGLANLKNLKSLRYLNLNALRSYNLDRDLEHIAGLTDLEELDIQDSMVSDAGLAYLSKLYKLRRLNLLKTSPAGKITDAGLAHLKNLKSLEELTVPNGITDAGIERLAALDSLKKINLWGDDITDKSMSVLAQMKSLETLEISSRNITDAGIEKLVQCPHLKSLSLQNTPITEAALSNLSKIKTLTGLSFWHTNINGKGFSFLKELPQLTDLSFMSENFAEDSTLHIGQIKTLKVLRLQYIGFDFDDKTIADLSNLVLLKNLSIVVQSTHRLLFTDAGIAHFGKLVSLEHLYISDCSNITDEGLKHFEGLSSLKQLRLDKSKVTMAGVASLKQKIPNVAVTVPCTMQAYQTEQKATKQPPLRGR